MEAINYTTFRKNLAETIDRVNDNHCPVLITRQKGKPAVIISLEDFRSYEETDYLLSNPRNAKRLMDSIEELEKGNGLEKGIIEE